MMKPVLLLLACLTLALQAVAQAPQKAAPNDLVVTAEIVGYSSKPKGLMEQTKSQTGVMLYAKMTVRNMIDHPRDIFMMTCDWPNSWIANGPNGLSEVSFQPGCDHNFPNTYSIPAHEAVVFNCWLWFMNGHLMEPSEHYEAKCFRLGFLDVTYQDDVNGLNDDIASAHRIKKAAHVYWSNTLSDVVNPVTMKKREAKGFYNTFQLTWEH